MIIVVKVVVVEPAEQSALHARQTAFVPLATSSNPPLLSSKAFITPLSAPAGLIGIPEASSGIPSPPTSPPVSAITIAKPGSSSSDFAVQRRGAAHTIAGECERLFCETLRTIFLVEGNMARQDSLAMGEHSTSNDTSTFGGGCVGHFEKQDVLHLSPGGFVEQTGLVKAWCEVWDYVGGTLFRCFIVENQVKEKALFVFFDGTVNGRDLKPGLMALLELCEVPEISCSQLVVCLNRYAEVAEQQNLLRDLGWVGFEATTLETWSRDVDIVSSQWLFLGMEV